MSDKPTLCLDFDGVIHAYTSGWKGVDVIPDPPVDGAIEFLWKAIEKFHVCIFSTRNSSPAGIDAMRNWLGKYDALYWNDKPNRPRTSLTLCIDFPTQKPAAFVGLDDRVLTFHGVFLDINTLLTFTPWNKPERATNAKYVLENRSACVCVECGRYADIPGTIVHGRQCSQAPFGAKV